MPSKYIFPFLFVLFISCNGIQNESSSTKNPVNDSLFTLIIDIHNEVMPKMGELEKLKNELTSKMNEENSATYEKAIALLDSSDESMMSWMHAFDHEKAVKPTKETTIYLEQELIKVKEMKTLFMESLENGEALIKE